MIFQYSGHTTLVRMLHNLDVFFIGNYSKIFSNGLRWYTFCFEANIVKFKEAQNWIMSLQKCYNLNKIKKHHNVYVANIIHSISWHIQLFSHNSQLYSLVLGSTPVHSVGTIVYIIGNILTVSWLRFNVRFVVIKVCSLGVSNIISVLRNIFFRFVIGISLKDSALYLLLRSFSFWTWV